MCKMRASSTALATHLTPGVVSARSAPVSGLLDIGRWPGGSDHIAREIAADLSAATFSSAARDDIPRWKWGKLLMNLANAVDALCGPEARAGEIAVRAREEGVACLRKAGIPYSGPDENRARREAIFATTRPTDGTPRGAGISSSWQSLARSAGAIETDYLNGEIVLLGRLHGVPTPVNEILQTVATLTRPRTPRPWHLPGAQPAGHPRPPVTPSMSTCPCRWIFRSTSTACPTASTGFHDPLQAADQDDS
jgi:2-dehydropantoate 2-reductase